MIGMPSVRAHNAEPAAEAADAATDAAVVLGGAPRTDVLWSAATAHDIVEVIAEDARAGRVRPAEAMDMIDRVWARAAPASPRPITPPRRPGPRRRNLHSMTPAPCGRD